MNSRILKLRAIKYAKREGIVVDFDEPLGEGTDGNVWTTSRLSAIKVLKHKKNYVNELECYQRLMERGIEKVDGLAVPKLYHYDDSLGVLEMEVVKPPYLLDFGKAYIDQNSPYTQEELARYTNSMYSHFPASDLPRLKKVCQFLRRHGIIYLDAKPKNIRFRTDAEERAFIDPDWDREPPTDYSCEGLEE
jgi:hypothetical protein